MSDTSNNDPPARGASLSEGEEQLGDVVEPLDAGQKSILNIVAGILAVRAPTRLVVDGILCLMAWIVMGTVVDAFQDDVWRASQGVRTPAFREPLYWIELLPSVLYYIGVVLVAVGCCRIIADRLPGVQRGRDEESA